MRPLVEETNGVQTLNIYGPGGQIIAQVVQDAQGRQEVPYLLADHLGSTRTVLDADGNAVARFEYGPHGETTAAGTAAAEVRYRYTGHPWDEAQGVYETPARQYDPTLGRFLSVDPKREGASPYVYAGNNPLGYVDPTGAILYAPFFMQSGFTVSGDHLRSAKAIAIGRAFDMFDKLGQTVHRDTIFRSAYDPPAGVLDLRSFAETKARYLMKGRGAGQRQYRYTDELFWFIGSETDVSDMNRLQQGMVALEAHHDTFARKITIVNFSRNSKKGEDLQKALSVIGKDVRLLEAELLLKPYKQKDHFIEVVDKIMYQGEQLAPRKFAARITSTATFVETDPQEVMDEFLPRLDTVGNVPQASGYTFGESSGAGQWGMTSQGFHQPNGTFVEFPSVPGVQVSGHGQVGLTQAVATEMDPEVRAVLGDFGF